MKKTTQFDVVPLEEVLKTAVPIDEPDPSEILPEPDQKSAAQNEQLDEPERRQV